MTPLFTLVNLAHTMKVTLRQHTRSTASLLLTCSVFQLYFFGSSSMQKHVYLWHTAYMKSVKPLRDSGDMLQIVNLIPILNWISRSLTNTTAMPNISDHTISISRGTLELKITKILPQYQATTWLQLLQWKSCNYIIHNKVIRTTDFTNSNKSQFNQEVCYRIAGALTTVTPSWGCQTQPIGLTNRAPDTADRPQAATVALPKDVSH